MPLLPEWAQTFRPEATNRFGSLDGARLALRWERRRFNGFSYRFDLARAGAGYDPAMGFERRRNYHSLSEIYLYVPSLRGRQESSDPG